LPPFVICHKVKWQDFFVFEWLEQTVPYPGLRYLTRQKNAKLV
jgi:hypothetical protein